MKAVKNLIKGRKYKNANGVVFTFSHNENVSNYFLNEGQNFIVNSNGCIGFMDFTIFYELEDFQYGEEVEVSNNCKNWNKRTFISMNPKETDFKYITVNDRGTTCEWKQCRKPNTELQQLEKAYKELGDKINNLKQK